MSNTLSIDHLPDSQSPSLDDPSGIYFYIFLAVAVSIVVLFCRKQFQQFSADESGDDYVGPLMPRHLATPEEYAKGLAIYAGMMIFMVCVLSLLNTKTLRDFGIPIPESLNSSVVPLIGALMLVGILPNIPVLQEIERWLRRYAHERAFIPASARAMADTLATADFDFSAYARQDVLLCAEMRGVDQGDFAMPRRSLEYCWARLSCLAYELDRRRASGEFDPLDGELLRRYAKHLDGIGEQRRTLEAQVAQYRKEKSSFASYTNYTLHRSIQDTLYRLYVLLGCAVRMNMGPESDVNQALQPFGFKLNQPIPPSDNRILPVGAIVIVGAASLLVEYVAVGLFHLSGKIKLWDVSPLFPQTWAQPVVDTTSSLILYGAAIIAAGMMRTHALKRNIWFTATVRSQRPSIAIYLAVAAASGLMGCAGLIVWGMVFQSITVDALVLTGPYMLLAAATGGYWVYHLDNAKLQERPAAWREIGGQAAVTGLCGLVASSMSFAILIGSAAPALDRILLTGVISVAIGGLLGWYTPNAATAAVCDPLAKGKEHRLQALEAAALKQFGEAAAVARWMREPQAALGDRSPESAAAEVEGFEHALNLLRGSLALAA